MKIYLLALIGSVFGFCGCSATPDSQSALLDDLLSGTGTKLPIDPARASIAGEYFFHFDEMHFPSQTPLAQYWGPQTTPLDYAGVTTDRALEGRGDGHIFGPDHNTGSAGEIDGWFRLLPQATAAGLTKAYRINAKIFLNVLQNASTAGNAKISVGCITKYPTPELPFAFFEKETASIPNIASMQWNSQVLTAVSGPLKLNKCVSDVFVSFIVVNAFTIQVFNPEVQLLAVTGG